MTTHAWKLVAALSVALGSCGDETTGDRVPPACVETIDECVAEPEPVEWSCASGWAAAVHGACRPDVPETCAAGTMARVGQVECATVGASCPAAGDWPAPPAGAGEIVYVRAGASGGTGSAASPYGSIGAAVSAAADNAAILVAGGVYSEAIVLARPVTLVGACATETVLEAPDASEASAILDIAGSGIVVENMQIRGPRFGVWVRGQATLDGVWVDATIGTGVLVHAGGEVEIRGSLVTNTDSRPSDATFGTGLGVESGTAVVSRSTFEGNRDYGVRFRSDAVVDASEILVRNTRSRESDGQNGHGMQALGGATVVVRSSLFANNRDVGLLVHDAATEVMLTDVVVSDTIAPAAGGEGRGVSLEPPARLIAERLLVAGSAGLGVLIGGDQTEALFTDVVVSDSAGDGVQLFQSAVLVGSRLVIHQSQGNGLLVAQSAVAQVRDLWIVDTEGDASGERGNGLLASDAIVDLTRARLERNRQTGIWLEEQASVVARDLRVIDTRSRQSESDLGRAIGVLSEASLTVERGLFDNNREVGLGVGDVFSRSTHVDLTDVVVRNTQSQEGDGRLGRGIQVLRGGVLTAERLRVLDNRAEGIIITGTATMTDVVVANTRAQACAVDTCADRTSGMGLCIIGGNVIMTNFVIEDSELAGVQVIHAPDIGPPEDRMPTLSFLDGTVRRNLIGANIQASGFDYDSFGNTVFEENTVELDAQELPVPDVGL